MCHFDSRPAVRWRASVCSQCNAEQRWWWQRDGQQGLHCNTCCCLCFMDIAWLIRSNFVLLNRTQEANSFNFTQVTSQSDFCGVVWGLHFLITQMEIMGLTPQITPLEIQSLEVLDWEVLSSFNLSLKPVQPARTYWATQPGLIKWLN